MTKPEHNIAEFRVVGKGFPRIDGVAKVIGKAIFTADISLPGMLYGKVLRSLHAHALIKGIDISAAESLPGVKAVITGKEFGDLHYAFVDTPRYPADQRPMAVNKVRYLGEEVAVVVAVSQDIAEKALDLINVDYEVLPAVFTPEHSLKPNAPLIHEEEYEGRSVWEDWGVNSRTRKNRKKNNNLSAQTEINFGDIEKGFAEADYIRNDCFETQTTAHAALEPHAVVANYDPQENQLELWLSSMGIFYKRFILSKLLKLPVSKIRIRQSFVGGAFGGKVDVFPFEFYAAYLARKLSKPVKIVLDREEVFQTTRLRHPARIDIKTGVKSDGTITAQEIKLIVDNGAYRGSGPVVIFLCQAFTLPLYKIPNFSYQGKAVYTNNPVRGPQRAHGSPQIRFAVDSQLDMICSDLGLDTLEVMLKNARQQGDRLPNDDVLASCGLTECLEKAAQRGNWQARRVLNRGKSPLPRFKRGQGLSVCSMFSGAPYYPFGSTAIIKLHDDGAATLFTGAVEFGQGAYTTLAQIAAEELGVNFDDIQVVGGDTLLTPTDMGSWLSNGALVTGNAVKAAAADAKHQLLAAAAEILEANPADLAIRERIIYLHSYPEKNISFSQAIQYSIKRNNGNPIIGTGSYKAVPGVDFYPSLATGQGRLTSAYGFAAQLVEVQVDTWTGNIEIVQSVTFHDCGFALNKDIVQGQIHGNISMGLGQALSEEVIFNQGQIINPNFCSYQVPLAPDTPSMIGEEVVTDEPNGPFGAKEAGEGSISGVLAAVANAVYNAAGVRIKSLPITPDKILKELEELKKQQ